MTYRAVTAWGMIAGLSYEDTRRLSPGMLLDLYVLRRAYDDEQHGIKRGNNDDHDISTEDAESFKEVPKDGGA